MLLGLTRLALREEKSIDGDGKAVAVLDVMLFVGNEEKMGRKKDGKKKRWEEVDLRLFSVEKVGRKQCTLLSPH